MPRPCAGWKGVVIPMSNSRISRACAVVVSGCLLGLAVDAVAATAADGFTDSVGTAYSAQLHIYGAPLSSDVPSGGSYAGLASKVTAAQNGADFLGSEAVIRGGSNTGAASTVSMAWRSRTDIEVSYINSDTGLPYPRNRFQYPPLAWDSYNMVSDVVKLAGVNGPYVLQMDYDENELIYLNTDPVYTEESFAEDGWLYVGWFEQEGPAKALGALPEDDEWVRATLGNSTTGDRAVPNFQGSFDQFLPAHPDFDPNDPDDMNDYLGSTGVDIVADRVWAIIDHTGEFGAVPEPATIGLLAVGGLALIRRRK